MQLTNKMGLPSSIVAALKRDDYTKQGADFSATELLNPPQISYLYKKHAADIVEDASDRIWSLLGQAVHSVIERASDEVETLSETTLVTNFEGITIKGTVDSFALSAGELHDFKVTSVWKAVKQEYDDWIAQTNIYRWLIARERGLTLNTISLILILRDWSKREAGRNPDYPAAQVVRVQVPVWTDEQVETLLRERIAAHRKNPPPSCSDADIWAKPAKFALMKNGRKSAVRLYDTEAEARAAIPDRNHYVEARPGIATRCLDYCAVAPFCEQWATDPRNPTINGVSEETI